MKINLLPKLSLLWALAATTGSLTAAGNLDKEFNTSGIVIKDFGGTDSLSTVTVRANGKILAAGTTDVSGHDDILVVRYLSNGTLDPTFSADGSDLINLTATSNETVTAMAIQPDGKIVVVGYTDANSWIHLDMFAVRLNADGGLDPTFGFAGKYTINPTPAADDKAAGVCILPDGKIMIAG